MRKKARSRSHDWSDSPGGIPKGAVMLLVHGITQVLRLTLSKAASAAISGIAGIGHGRTGLVIDLLLIPLKKAAENKTAP